MQSYASLEINSIVINSASILVNGQRIVTACVYSTIIISGTGRRGRAPALALHVP